MDYNTAPASDYSISDLVDILNRSFAGYHVPILFNGHAFLNMLRKDGIDLTSSRVLLAEERPVGLALLARRGWTARLAAMGLSQDMRGKGAGSWLMERLLSESRLRGEKEMVLEVIEQNEPAVHLYKKCGFQIVRRLIGFICDDAVGNETGELREFDIREAARLLAEYGLSDLPWQVSSESIAQLNPPARAYQDGQAMVVVSNPEADDVGIWSLLVKPDRRGQGLGTNMLRALIGCHPGKTWHVPALLPEELGKPFVRAGFVEESLSQWQMKLTF